MNTDTTASAERFAEIAEQADAQRLAAYVQSQNPKRQFPLDELTDHGG